MVDSSTNSPRKWLSLQKDLSENKRKKEMRKRKKEKSEREKKKGEKGQIERKWANITELQFPY